jgi:hypothetical protein
MADFTEGNEMSYDSTEATREHITKVANYLLLLADALEHRCDSHDSSKLEPPEKEIFDKVTPKLNSLHYGSDEYRASLAEMGPALQHHYAQNRHHPEHFEKGIAGMDLVDLVEMFCDWCAATERHADGDIEASVIANRERFGYDLILANIFVNTARNYHMGRGCERLQRVGDDDNETAAD